MNTQSKTASIIGVLFILGFAGIVTTVLVQPILDDPDYLMKAAKNETRLLIGVLFQITMSFAVTGIAIWMYPVLRMHHEALALWSVGFRLIEATLQFVATLALLSLLSLSQVYVKAAVPDASYFQALGALLRAGNDWAFGVLSQIAFILGALIYYYLFYISRLIPRWLSIWGLFAVIMHLAGVFLIMFDQVTPLSAIVLALALPIAAQELTLAGWLIVKGFNPSAIVPEPAR